MSGTARIVGTSGHVIQSVPFAIFAASTIRESSFEEVLSEIIRSGGDTDTNGDSTVKRILIIPTKNLSYHGDFTHEVEIIR